VPAFTRGRRQKGDAMPVRSLRVFVALTLVALSFAAVGASAARGEDTGTAETYVVLYKQQAVPADAARTIQRAGGTLIANYSAIGVVIARSSNASFRSNLLKDSRIEGAAATTNFGVKIDDGQAVQGESAEEGGGPPEELPNAPATDADTFSPKQWDMRQIKAPQAHAITGGSPAVIVGDIDTGLDKDHPDLVANIDFTKSVSCESGAPDPDPAAWDDRHGHGTHTAGTIVADDNGGGIVGVAPNVKVAGIKSSTDEGFFFPEMVICSFMWAGSQHLDVTNNSYFADPFLYNCRNDPEQRAIWKAEQRAILYAQKQGVTVVAAAGNESDDLAHPQYDVISPDFPPGEEEEREITNACVQIPVEIPGVIGVSANGHNRQIDGDDDPNDYLKSFYSNYGVGQIEVVAPGGDSIFGTNAEAPNGRVLSTWPEEIPCTRLEVDAGQGGSTYCYLQGTSMASPHVAGVAALIVSRFGDLDNPQNGKMRPSQVAAYIQQTAAPQPCPTELPEGYEEFTRPAPAGVEPQPQTCEGGPGYNSWYGNGQVDAYNAVTKASTNQTTAG
jgi:subtilisin family serine protease